MKRIIQIIVASVLFLALPHRSSATVGCYESYLIVCHEAQDWCSASFMVCLFYCCPALQKDTQGTVVSVKLASSNGKDGVCSFTASCIYRIFIRDCNDELGMMNMSDPVNTGYACGSACSVGG